MSVTAALFTGLGSVILVVLCIMLITKILSATGDVLVSIIEGVFTSKMLSSFSEGTRLVSIIVGGVSLALLMVGLVADSLIYLYGATK